MIFFLFFILRKLVYAKVGIRFLVHSIEMSKKVVEKESQQVSLSTISSPLGGHCMHMGRRALEKWKEWELDEY